MEKSAYSLYICRYSKISYSVVERMLTNVDADSNVYVKDVSDLPLAEKLRNINSLIISERLRIYKEGARDFYVTFVRFDADSSYLLILSVQAEKEDSIWAEKLRKNFFGTRELKSMQLYDGKIQNKHSLEYWEKAFPETKGFHEYEKKGVDRELLQVETFEVTGELGKLIADCIRMGKSSLKSILLSQFGRLACHVFNQDRAILFDVHEGGYLTQAPLLVDRYLSGSALYNKVRNQLIMIEQNDMCTDFELACACEKTLNSLPSSSVYYVADSRYLFFLNSMEPDEVYYDPAILLTNSPLNALFSLGKTGFSCTYIYMQESLNECSMEDVHHAFCRMLHASLLGKYQEHVPDIPKTVPEKIEKRKLDAKAATLKKLRIYADYSDEDIKRVAKDYEVVFRREEQTVIEADTKITKLYVPVSGRIEANRFAKGQTLPLYLLKEGDFIGLEGLCEGIENHVGFRVRSENAVMLAIDVDIFMKEAKKHPQILLYLLGQQSVRLDKFERLWSKV